MENMMKPSVQTVIEIKENSNGRIFGLFAKNGTFGVWELCQHYKYGQIRKSWRYIERNMTEENARKLFAKKTK